MTPENQNIRVALQKGFQEIYANLIDFLNKLDIDKKLKDYAFMNLDQGLFWSNMAISSLPLPQPAEPVENNELPANVDCAAADASVEPAIDAA